MKIVLGDLSYINDANRGNLYVPLNVGYLAAAAKKRFGADVSVRIFKDPRALLDHAADHGPDLVGLASYYWNDRLNDLVGRRLYGRTTIIAGGPSIDTDQEEQARYMRERPWLSHVVPNEGEDGFLSIVEAMLSGEKDVRVGTGLSTDLAGVPSPYLDGVMDEFLAPDQPYQPMIQTSRLCPYTCAFCVSGKSRGKLRAFPLEQVREEVRYIGERFAGRDDMILYVVDENFGILDRDREIATMIAGERRRTGFPRRLFYYNDKRFTQTSRDVHEIVGDMCWHGVTLSLQSENPETLKAIKRRNLTDEQVADALAWAKGLGLKTSTELIFGLPMETRESFFALLDKCARAGFDAVQCYNLIVFDGIEMNRQRYRAAHEVVTKRRLMPANRGVVDGESLVESEEVVVSSTGFDEDTFRLVRAMTVFFHAIYVRGVCRDRINAAVAAGRSLTGILVGMVQETTSPAHAAFLRELWEAIDGEFLGHDVVAGITAGRLPLPPPLKVQPVLAERLVQDADSWVADALDVVLGDASDVVSARC